MSGAAAAFGQLAGLSEPQARVLLSLLGTYPFAIAYQALVPKNSVRAQHVYFLLSGLFLSFFVVGWGILHQVCDVLVVYLIFQFLGATSLSVAITWVVCMTHLLYGYVRALAVDEVHDPSSWTLPQCVLTLKLIGTMMDCFDGQKREEKQSGDQRENSVKDPPDFIELVGYSFHFGTVLVGPIMTFRRYREFVNGTLFNREKHGRDSIFPGIVRLLFGLSYVMIFTAFGGRLPTDYLASMEYAAQPLFYRLGYLVLWGKVTIVKYVGVWLLVEGASIITGITYNGKDKNGSLKWDGLANAWPVYLESSYRLQDVIAYFNRTTNNWVLRHIYKRMRFLNNKVLSQSVTVVFLAIWHGLQPGYFINFLFEIPSVLAEQKLEVFFHSLTGTHVSSLPLTVRIPVGIVLHIVRCLFLHYPLATFTLLRWGDCIQFMSSVYFFGHIICIGWILVMYAGLGGVARGRKPKSEN